MTSNPLKRPSRTPHGSAQCRRWLPALAVLAAFAAAPPALAGTLAYYRFEEGNDGAGTPGLQASGADNVVDSAGGDDPFRSFSAATAPTYAAVVPGPTVPRTGAPNALSSLNANGDDLFQSVVGPLRTHVFTDFTIETYVNFTAKGNFFQTIVGRDDAGNPGAGLGPQSLMYLGVGANNAGAPLTGGAFRFEIIDASGGPNGSNRQINSTFVPVVNRWYHLAATGNVTTGTLELFVDGVSVGTVGGYTGLFDSPTDTSWTIGRGQFNGNPGDTTRAYIDEVRFSDMALAPQDFLNAVVPEPAAAGMLAIAMTAIAALRRRT